MEMDENLCDDFSSFLPTPEDYNFEELDEILRSTETQLDSSIDLSALPLPNSCYDIQMQGPQRDTKEYDMILNTMPLSGQLDTAEPPQKIIEDNNFNPDDFINFLNEDDLKMEELSPAISLQSGDSSNQRGTPSPTGSCNSSTDSLTSGIQSDASSVSSSQSFNANEVLFDNERVKSTEPYASASGVETEPMDVPPPLFLDTQTTLTTYVGQNQVHTQQPHQQQQQQRQHKVAISTPKATPPAVLPITLPLMSLQTSSGATSAVTTSSGRTLFQAPSNSFNVLQGTLIPVKTVPLSSVTNIKAPIPIKVQEPKLEPKLAPKTSPTSSSSSTTTTLSVKTSKTAETPKVSPASLSTSNSKPKTIYLSPNDFKALMQKLKTTGKGSAKSNSSPASGQMPKIIMKTINGQAVNISKSTATQLVSKSALKPAAPLVIQQHPTKSMILTKAEALSPALKSPEMNIYKSILDEKAIKKQQRMIKNRESASLSRKKKKEYMVSLESRISDLEKENISLKGENSSLRSQLVAFAQTCQCKHGNISDFILNSLNISSKGDVITGINDQQQHVRIAPKPSMQKSIKQRMLASSVKKNIAVLFAMAFMVTLNIGSFQSYIKRDAIESAGMESVAEENAVAPGGAIVGPVAGGIRRGLLWEENENKFGGVKLNRSRRAIEMQVPPLHFLRPHPRANEQNGNATNNMNPPNDNVRCPRVSNLTEAQRLAENQRLASNLHKWIGGNDYLNLSTTTHAMFSGNRMDFNFKPDYFDLKTYDIPLDRSADYDSTSSGQHKRNHHYLRQTDLNDEESSRNHGKFGKNIDSVNSLDFYKPKVSEEYLRLFKSIKRQADTFYVLSFSMDHILLPASAYNKSSRPKMSLMLPSGDPDLNGDIVLMRVDCEVVNTTEMQLKSEMIPEKLRPTKIVSSGNDVTNNETRTTYSPVPHKKPKMDINNGNGVTANASLVNSANIVGNINENVTLTKSHSTQRIGYLQNVSVTEETKGLDSQVARNATLYQRMRKTVEYMP